MTTICVLCGGVGAARFLRGLLRVVTPSDITAIVNTADDMRLHGLAISPDLDTCTYTLAEVINPETGWGLVGETWQAKETLDRYGGQTWFGLGDRDLGTHLYRTQRLDEGATLADVTREITAAWDLELNVLPMSNDAVRTHAVVGNSAIHQQALLATRRSKSHAAASFVHVAEQRDPRAATAIDHQLFQRLAPEAQRSCPRPIQCPRGWLMRHYDVQLRGIVW